MNKIEIQAIKEYCHTISDLCIEINHGFESGKYRAYFEQNNCWWDITVRGTESLPIYSIELNEIAAVIQYTEKYKVVLPIPENFEQAIAKLQGYLKEMQEDEVLDRVRTYR